MSKSERDRRPRARESYFAFYDAGSLAASFRHKMHIGYFYDNSRESARERLAVFRDINFEKGGYASFESGDFNVGKKRSRFPKGEMRLDYNFETLMEKSGNIFHNFFFLI